MRFDSSRAIFLQIEDYLISGILAGHYLEGERLPSIRELAGKMEVNPNTVVRSYGELQEFGLVENRRGLGYFVASGAQDRVRELEKGKILKELLPKLVKQMQLLGMEEKDFLQIWRKTMGEKNENEN